MKEKNLNFAKWMAIILLAMGFFVSSCTKEEAVKTSELDLVNLKDHHLEPAPATANSCDLIAGQYIDVGEVLTWEKDGELFVRYITSGDWKLYEAHVYYGLKKYMPLNKNGGPKIGQFTVSVDDLPGLTTVTYRFDLVTPDEDECLVLAVHAVVATNDDMGDEETAWSRCSETPLVFTMKAWFGDYTEWGVPPVTDGGVALGEKFWCSFAGVYKLTQGEGLNFNLVNEFNSNVGSVLMTPTADENGFVVSIVGNGLSLQKAHIFIGTNVELESYFVEGSCPDYTGFPIFKTSQNFTLENVFNMNQSMESIPFDGSSWGWYTEYCN